MDGNKSVPIHSVTVCQCHIEWAIHAIMRDMMCGGGNVDAEAFSVYLPKFVDT